MRITIDGKPVDQLTPKQEKTFFLAKKQDEVKGRVLTPEEATASFIAQIKRWYTIGGSLLGVFMLLVVIGGVVGEPRYALFIIVLALVASGSVVLMMLWGLRYRGRKFARKLDHRSEGLMPVGTVLAIDANGLSVGPQSFAWPTLSIDAVELTSGSLPSGDTSTPILIVERLAVASGGKVFMLDRAMTENGLLLVDNTWRRLHAST